MTYGQRCNSVGEGKNGSFTPSRFTNGPPSWILMDQFPLTTIIQSRKRFVIRPPLQEIMATFSSWLKCFYSSSLSLSSILSRHFCRWRSRFRSSRSRLITPPPHSFTFIIRGTLKNTRKHYKPCFCFILIIIPRWQVSGKVSMFGIVDRSRPSFG